ncbi:MAG: hypothetical protein EZS28_046307 [Streblomastix strix]|uniref:Uncharacterized protein n=1 Tax=Streblomastix strix TaxID=222440 RepID=A0A5J4TKW0_9EUKA|nr:MAG: hypothetical protein EZS28_046307 [Streblomastix strix]
MTTGSTVPTPTYPSDTTNSKQTNGREGISVDDPLILIISTLSACTREYGIMIDSAERRRRSLSPWGQDEKVKETSAIRKNDGCIVRGNRGDELFRYVLNQRCFASIAVKNVINGQHKAWRRQHQKLGLFVESWLNKGKRREDLLSVEQPELEITNFISQFEAEDINNINQANCRSALNTLFQLQRFKKEEINGVSS